MRFKTVREPLYARGAKAFNYVTYLNGRRIDNGDTKEEAERNALETILGAIENQTSTIYASLCIDGAILTTREYAPGFVEQSFHRPDYAGRASGSCMQRCEINGKRASVPEIHQNRLAQYNEVAA